MNRGSPMLSSHIAASVGGRGLAVCARRRFGIVADLTVDYSDHLSLPEQRALFPSWSGDPLAPVTIAQDSALLDRSEDSTYDFLIAFEFPAAAEGGSEAMAGAARVVRPGGHLVLLKETHGDHATSCHETALAGAVRLHPLYASLFDWQSATAIGRNETAVVLERSWPDLGEGELVSWGPDVYVVDEGTLRHVQSPAVLALIQDPGQSITSLVVKRFMRMALGKGLSETGARAMLGRRREWKAKP